MTLTRLLIRRHRGLLGVWLLLLIGLCGGTASAYQNTYHSDEQRLAAVHAAQHDPATTLLYGRLPDPGTPAQLFAWEVGALVTILAAVFAVLLAVALTRTAEDDGTIELVRGCGVAPGQPLRSASTVLVGAGVLLGLGCGGAAALVYPAAGSMALGTAVALTFLLVSSATTLLSQVAANAGQARALSFAVLGVAFGLRAAGDTRGIDVLTRFGPFGPRAALGPFTADRWAVAVPFLLAALVPAAAAWWIARRREFGAGLLAGRDTGDRRLRVRTPAGLAVRLARSSILGWTVAVTAAGTLFAVMGSGTVEQSRSGELGGFLGAQLTAPDPAAAYLSFSDTVVGIVVCCYAVLSMLSARRAEADGRTDLVLATGVRRWQPLAAQAVVTAVSSLLILAATGALSALLTPRVMAGDDVALRSFAYAVGQWPAAVAATGCAALVIGLRPRRSALAWLPVAASALLALLGTLLGVPRRVQEWGLLRHVPDFAAPSPRVGALLLLLAVGAVLTGAGLLAAARRDVAPA